MASLHRPCPLPTSLDVLYSLQVESEGWKHAGKEFALGSRQQKSGISAKCSIKEQGERLQINALLSLRLRSTFLSLKAFYTQIVYLPQENDYYFLQALRQLLQCFNLCYTLEFECFSSISSQISVAVPRMPCHPSLQVLATILVKRDHALVSFLASPKVLRQSSMASLMIWQAFSLPSNCRTSTSLFSNFLQSSKKRRTWSRRCLGSCSMSLQCETDMSLLATEMILSSSSPWSIIRITPITFASTRHSVSTFAEHSTRMSSGSLSWQYVCGMNPQFEGQCTALKSTRSSFSSPVSLSSSYFTLLYVGISISAVTRAGAPAPQGTACQGFVVNVAFLPVLIVTTINTLFQKYLRLIWSRRFQQTEGQLCTRVTKQGSGGADGKVLKFSDEICYLCKPSKLHCHYVGGRQIAVALLALCLCNIQIDMERFIFQVIEPLISAQLDEQRHRERTAKIAEQLRAFIKGELVPLNKDLSKKTRELFVATSDIEKLKEELQHLGREANRLRQELAGRESEIFKQKMIFERDIQTLAEEIDVLKKQVKAVTRKAELDLERLADEHKDRVFDLKREHKAELEGRLDEERTHWEGELSALREAHAQERSHLVQEGSKERSKLIKKYEEKLYNVKNEADDLLERTTRELQEKVDGVRKARSELEARFAVEEETTRRLTHELERETSNHRAFKLQFESTFKELEGIRRRHAQELQKLASDYEQLKRRSKQAQRVASQRIKALVSELSLTSEQKDKRFVDTVETMNTEHRIEVQSLQNNMMEEREIAITNVEVRAYEEMFQQVKKYEALAQAHRELQENYDKVRETYQARLARAEEEHESELVSLQERKNYEFELSGENSRRQYSNLQAKFTLQIRSLKSQAQAEQQALVRKGQEEKVALSNKLVSQYQAMLSDQRSNTEIQLKQKLLQFQRKGKAYEKRIGQGEKRKSQLKVTIERMKLQSQMKIESMMQANEKLQEEVQSLHERILELEKAKSTIINDYEFQLLLLRNEIDKVTEEFHQREDELRANLNERIVVKNKEIARFAERVKLETEELMRRNKDRVVAIEKEYQELKRVINQKTSLPEDIDALKVFHAAYLEKETELAAERRKREELQRELHSKDAIEKVFVDKNAFKRLTAIEKMSSTGGKLSFLRHT